MIGIGAARRAGSKQSVGAVTQTRAGKRWYLWPMDTAVKLWGLALVVITSVAGCDDGSSAEGPGGGGATTTLSTGGSGGDTTTAGGAGNGAGGAGGSGAAGGGGSGGAAMVPITLLSLNLHCFKLEGTTFADNAARFAAITSFAAAQGVDAMMVQEACKRPGENAIETLRTGLSAATGDAWSSVWLYAHIAWEGTPDEAEEGVGLLLRGESSSEVGLDHAVQGVLHRAAVSARLPPALGGARVMSVHFDVFDPDARASQAREAAAAALYDAQPAFDAIAGGDFNDVEGSDAWSAFVQMGYLPADQGVDPAGIDHVMIHRAAPLRPTGVEIVLTGQDAVSDHPGVLVHLEPAAGDPVTATRISTPVDPGLGHFLSIRGDMGPLSWNTGIPLRKTVDGGEIVFTELQGMFQFKLLRDDTDWQQGPNENGTAGTNLTVEPVF